jgi:hypothetical protein
MVLSVYYVNCNKRVVLYQELLVNCLNFTACLLFVPKWICTSSTILPVHFIYMCFYICIAGQYDCQPVMNTYRIYCVYSPLSACSTVLYCLGPVRQSCIRYERVIVKSQWSFNSVEV